MPRMSPDYVPKYRLHRQSGLGIVTLSYRDYTLGKFGTPDSLVRYHALIAKWIEGGRKPLNPAPEVGGPAAPMQFTVGLLIDAWMNHAAIYYRRPDGAETNEVRNLTRAYAPLRTLFEAIEAKGFGPLHLKAYRERLVAMGRVRSSINKDVERVRRAFRWAVSEQLVPASVLEGLRALAPLKRGRSDAKEAERVKPVSAAAIEATMAQASKPVAALIQILLHTGARAGEVVAARVIDIDRSTCPWIYRPAQHKGTHLDRDRVIHFGPRCRTVLQPLIETRGAGDYLFSPLEGNADLKARNAKGKRRTGQKPNPRRTAKRIGEHYTVDALRRSITYAADKADRVARHQAALGGKPVQEGARLVERWHPHQLRHSAATLLRAKFGVDAAETVLGHSSLNSTAIYAEQDVAKAARIIEEIG